MQLRSGGCRCSLNKVNNTNTMAGHIILISLGDLLAVVFVQKHYLLELFFVLSSCSITIEINHQNNRSTSASNDVQILCLRQTVGLRFQIWRARFEQQQPLNNNLKTQATGTLKIWDNVLVCMHKIGVWSRQRIHRVSSPEESRLKLKS